jgi:hypothetical protein
MSAAQALAQSFCAAFDSPGVRIRMLPSQAGHRYCLWCWYLPLSGMGLGPGGHNGPLARSGNAFGSSAYVLFAPSSQPTNENYEGQKMKAWPQSVMGDCRSARVGTDTTCDEEKRSSRNMSRTSCIQRTTTTDHCIYVNEEKAQLRTGGVQGKNLDFGTSTLYLASESCSSARSLHKCSSTRGKYDFCAFDAAGDDVPNPWLGLSIGGPHTDRSGI